MKSGQAQGKTIDQLAAGQSAERAHVVTEADLVAFADVSGDHNPVHLDEAFAQTTQFKGRIAHGMLSAAYISALLAGELPGPGSVYLSQTLAFKRPVRIGDEVVSKITVTAVDAERGRVTLATQSLVNGKVVVDGEATVMAPKAAV